MMLIFLIFVAIFLPSMSCLKGPFIHDNHTQSITIKDGASVKLECYAGGETNPSIKWHMEPFPNSTNRNTILPNGEQSYYGNVLEFPSITRHQRGIYICSVNDQYGSASRYIPVIVNFIPIIIEMHLIRRYESKEIEFRCNAESDPPANVRWFKDDEEVQITDYKIITNRESDDMLNSTIIESIKSNYYPGTYVYKCRIENQLGVVTRTLTIEYDYAFLS